MTNIAPELPPPGLPPAPEGGDILVQSGWRLAVREFAQNKLAVAGLAALIFFVLFCYLGPLVYHGGLSSDLEAVNLPPGPGHPLGTADYPILLAYTLVGAVLVVVGNFAADIALMVSDPRIRLV